MLKIERHRTSRRVGVITLIGVLVIPLVVAAGFLAATWNSQNRLNVVQAAVVNLDQPVTVSGQLVPLGRQLSGALVDGTDAGSSAPSDPQQNFDWVLSDQADAAAGLASGKYAAVVTIPKAFSAQATSYAKNKAADAEHATLQVQTSSITGVTDPAISQAIAATAVRSLNRQLTEGYLKNIYLGFNTTQKQFTTVAAGAGDLSDGASSLSKGIGKTADGSATFATGLGKLSTGADQLSTGVGQLDTGAAKLAKGFDTLADGTAALPGQAGKLADGLDSTATGAKKLATGTAKLDRGAATFAAGTTTYARGAEKYATGAAAFGSGVSQEYAQLKQLTPGQIDQVCAQTRMSAVQCGAFQATVAQTLKGIFASTPAHTGPGGQRIPANPGLIKGAAGLAAGASQLSTGAGKLDTGAQGIASGLDGVSSGTTKLSGGLTKLAAGTDKLATGLGTLNSGIQKTDQGVDKLATGVHQLSSGATALATGAQKSADGADQLHTGLVKLDSGGDQLAGGAKKLADGLAKGAKQIPTYSANDRTVLASVVANPVDTQRPATLFSNQTTTTLLAVLALWLGALISYLVFRAVSSRAFGSTRSSTRLALEGLAPGAAIAVLQGIVLSVALTQLLDLDATQVIRTVAFCLFAGLTFAVVNQALVAWFGGVGRFVSAVALGLAAAAALTSALPGFFDVVRPFLPLTPALDGLRAIVADGSGAGHAVGVLLAWLVVGAAASVVAVARRRMLPAGARMVVGVA